MWWLLWSPLTYWLWKFNLVCVSCSMAAINREEMEKDGDNDVQWRYVALNLHRTKQFDVGPRLLRVWAETSRDRQQTIGHHIVCNRDSVSEGFMVIIAAWEIKANQWKWWIGDILPLILWHEKASGSCWHLLCQSRSHHRGKQLQVYMQHVDKGTVTTDLCL